MGVKHRVINPKMACPSKRKGHSIQEAPTPFGLKFWEATRIFSERYEAFQAAAVRDDLEKARSLQAFAFASGFAVA